MFSGPLRTPGPVLKCASALCIMAFMVISASFMAKYWQLYNVALDYNEAAVDGLTYD